jgi:hypothetical protein
VLIAGADLADTMYRSVTKHRFDRGPCGSLQETFQGEEGNGEEEKGGVS